MHHHSVQFYDDESFLLERVSKFVHSGLIEGEAVIVIAPAPHLHTLYNDWPKDSIFPRNPAHACHGRYIPLDAVSTLSKFMIAGWPDETRFNEVIGAVIEDASAGGATRVRAYGTMVALLCAEGNHRAAVRLEELWNKLSKTRPFSLLCSYPLGVFCDQEDGAEFEQICAAHTHVTPTERYRLADGNEDIHRNIALLEQKAQVLVTEVDKREVAEHLLAEREHEFSDFLENAAVGLHCVGPEGTILWANPAALGLLNLANDEYVGHHIAEFHVDDAVISDILQKLAQGRTLRGYPAKLYCKGGPIKRVLIHSSPLIKDGEFISSRWFTVDVTEKMKLEEELREKLAALAEVDRRKDEFLAMLGHELRNPLAPIVTSVEIMRLQPEDAIQIARCREVIARQAGMMQRLVDDMLDASRITRGKIELRPQAILLNPLIDRAVELARPQIDDRKHHLHVSLPAAPLPIFGDADRLAQALANLLNNAAKYTEAGGNISLSADKDGADAVVRVADNGIGLDPALLQSIFDMFVQAESSLRHARGGLGLGLTLARGIIQAHGGSIEASSAGLGCGSTFVVRLPLHPDTLPPNPEEPQPSTGEIATMRPRNILIADDNVDAAESLSSVLRGLGHVVRVVHNGESAVAEAGLIQPDVVILDIGMPGLDGYEVAQRLRTNPDLHSTVLVALTGYAQERDRKHAISTGFNYHFSKPMNIHKLEMLLQADF